MSRPDDYRGAPPGGPWWPTNSDQAVPPAGWAPEPGRPAGGPGWSAGVSGPGGAYPPADRGGGSAPVAGGSLGPGGSGSYRPAGGGPHPFTGSAAPQPTGAEPGGTAAGRPAPPAGAGGHRSPIDPAKLFGIVIAALGALNFVFGFLPQVTSSRIDESPSVYAVGPGYVPILLLIAGLLALAAILPGSERSRLAVAAVSVGGALGALISLSTTSSLELLAAGQVSKGLGAVLLTIFGIIQAVVAIAAYVVGADLRAGHRNRSAAEPATGGTDPSAPHGWTAAVPAPAWTTAPPSPSAPPPPSPAVSAEPTGSVGYYTGYAPVPGSAADPGGPAGRSSAMSGWEPSADDDRPTGPQPVIAPDSGARDRRSPAERELPRAAPGWPAPPPAGSGEPAGTPDPMGSTGQPAPSPDPRSRHAADDRTGPTPIQAPAPTEAPASIQAAPSQAPAPSQAAAPSQASAPSQVPAPSQAAAPSQVPAPSQASAPPQAPASPRAPESAPGGPDEGVTEVYRIPPRTPPDGPAGS